MGKYIRKYADRGPRVRNGVLTENEVRIIKFELLLSKAQGGQGLTPREVADRYDLSPEQVRRIKRGEAWSHVTPQVFDVPLEEGHEMTAEAKAAFERMRASLNLSDERVEQPAAKPVQRKSDALFEEAMRSMKPKEGA